MIGDRTRSVLRLTGGDWRVVLEALFLTPLAAAAVRVLPLDRAVRLAMYGEPARPAPVLTRRVASLASLTGACLGSSCLTRALVLQRMLQRRGVRSELVIGARRRGRRLEAHAWLRHDGRILAGEAGHRTYRVLCRLDGRRRTAAGGGVPA
jgi:hypothetical protein